MSPAIYNGPRRSSDRSAANRLKNPNIRCQFKSDRALPGTPLLELLAGVDEDLPAAWSSRSMSSRAFLNSFMLCPRLRAKSGNFFAPKRTRTMRRIINRSGPPRFPIPNASIFITILNWLGLMFYSSRSAYICFKMHGSLLYDLKPMPRGGQDLHRLW